MGGHLSLGILFCLLLGWGPENCSSTNEDLARCQAALRPGCEGSIWRWRDWSLCQAAGLLAEMPWVELVVQFLHLWIFLVDCLSLACLGVWGSPLALHGVQIFKTPVGKKKKRHMFLPTGGQGVDIRAFHRELGRSRLWCVHAQSLQSCLTLCDPMDRCLPGSSVHRILQARILQNLQAAHIAQYQKN